MVARVKAEGVTVEDVLGPWLDSAFRARGWSNYHVARLMGEAGLQIAPRGVLRICTGERIISLAEAIALAEMLDLELADLIEQARLRSHEHSMLWGAKTELPGGGLARHGRCSTCGAMATMTIKSEISWL